MIFSEIKQVNKDLESSLNFKRDFDYKQMASKEAKHRQHNVHLKLQSKILQPKKSQSSLKSKSEHPSSTLRSKSKSQLKLKLQTQSRLLKQNKSILKKGSFQQKQCGKTKIKVSEPKSKHKTSSLRANLTKKDVQKQQAQKDSSLINCLKQSFKFQSKKPLKKAKLDGVRSEAKIANPKSSKIYKSPTAGPSPSSIMHQYFGVSHKMLSKCDQHRLQKKKDRSKCRTYHSDNSSNTKNDIKFNKNKQKAKPQ